MHMIIRLKTLLLAIKKPPILLFHMTKSCLRSRDFSGNPRDKIRKTCALAASNALKTMLFGRTPRLVHPVV